MSEKGRPVEDQVVEKDVWAEILETYKSKKTPDGRRDCIKQLAKAAGFKEREIAEFLLEQGLQVDGRLVRGRKTSAVPSPAGPELPGGWDGPEEVKLQPEPEPKEQTPEPETPQCMTAGCLMEVLQKVAPGADVFIDGAPLRGMHITVCFGQDGSLTDAAVFLERE